jgi:tRNA nucleotidyltransferase (CCA-adding enzyme)
MNAQRTVQERTILAKLRPGKLPPLVPRTLERVQRALKREKAQAMLGGSAAKGTHLAGDHDIDVFVRFPPGAQDISDRLERALRATLKEVERVHGSRDYFLVRHGAYAFEFIPVLRVRSWREAKNVTDMSPLHVAYVQRAVKLAPSLADDIRLAKQFCKAARIYGAESHIGGFSGHVIDLLTIHYGSFRKLIEAAARWPDRVVLDPTHHHKDPARALNESKTLSPLIIVDPLQPERNSAAALTRDAFETFRARAKAYLAATPREQGRFFARSPLTLRAIQARYPRSRIIAVRLDPLPGKKDVSGAKCQKVLQHVLRALRDGEFAVHSADWEFTQPDKPAHLFIALDPSPLPRERTLRGPPSAMREAARRFRAAHSRTSVRAGHVLAIEPRAHTDALHLVRARRADAYVRERVRRASVRAVPPRER